MKRAVRPEACCLAAAVLALTSMAATGQGQGEEFPDITAIRSRLGSPRFEEREAAQMDLQRIPADALETLQAIAATENDPEVKARLELRLDEMATYRLLHPKSISLDVADASLKDLAVALGRAMALPDGEIGSMGVAPRQTWTLKARGLSFSEVLQKLSEQHPLDMHASGRGLIIAPATGNGQKWTFHDAFAIGVQERVRVLAATPNQRDVMVQLTFVADPRVKLARHSTALQVTELLDDQGKSLLGSVAMRPSVMTTIPAGSNSWTLSLDLSPAPVRPIASLKGNARVAVVGREQRVIVENVEKSVGKPVALGQGRITVESLQMNAANPTQLDLAVNVAFPVQVAVVRQAVVQPGGGVVLRMLQPENHMPLTLKLMNRQGGLLGLASLGANGGNSTIRLTMPGAGQKPGLRMELSLPTEVKEVDVPVEIKDIPAAPSLETCAGAAFEGSTELKGLPARERVAWNFDRLRTAAVRCGGRGGRGRHCVRVGQGSTTRPGVLDISRIREKLASPRFEDREAGQQELRTIPADQMEQLQSIAAGENDPEVKARLEVRVDELETYRALHPPAISVNLSDAAPAEVVRALNAALGSTHRAPIAAVGADQRSTFTLKADGLPFWEIVRKLDEQHTLQWESAGVNMALSLTNRQTNWVVQDCFAIYGSVTLVGRVAARGRVAGAQPGVPARTNVALVFVTDPRVSLAAASTALELKELRDDQGNNLLPNVIDPPGRMVSHPGSAIWTVNVNISPATGRPIASLKGVVRAMVVTQLADIQIQDIARKLGQAVSVGSGQLTINTLAPNPNNPNNMDMTITVTHLANPRPGAINRVNDLPLNAVNPMTIRIVDKDGKTVLSSVTPTIAAGTFRMRLSIPRAANAGPLTLDVAGPGKLKEVEIPVEMKDLAIGAVLPAAGPQGALIGQQLQLQQAINAAEVVQLQAEMAARRAQLEAGAREKAAERARQAAPAVPANGRGQ